MPELPEVEAAKRSLERVIRGKVIGSVEVRSPAVVRTHPPRAFVGGLEGKRIERGARRGKVLLFHLPGGRKLIFRFNLWGAPCFFSPAFPPSPRKPVVPTLSSSHNARL